METQNVTLALPKELLLKAKRLAVERNTSLSGLLAQAIADAVAQEEAYTAAQRSHRALLEQGFDLGTDGVIGWSREALHER
jgi:predicted transcriptional regulator